MTLTRILENERTTELTQLQAESIEKRGQPSTEAATNHIKHQKKWRKSVKMVATQETRRLYQATTRDGAKRNARSAAMITTTT